MPRPENADQSIALWCPDSVPALMKGAPSVSNPGLLREQNSELAFAFQHARDCITDIYICDMLSGLPTTMDELRTRVFVALLSLTNAVALLQFYTPRAASIYAVRVWFSKEIRQALHIAETTAYCKGLLYALDIFKLAPLPESYLVGVVEGLHSAVDYVSRRHKA